MGEEVFFSEKISPRKENMSLLGKEHHREKRASTKALRQKNIFVFKKWQSQRG